jgi:hypothetical protein
LDQQNRSKVPLWSLPSLQPNEYEVEIETPISTGVFLDLRIIANSLTDS